MVEPYSARAARRRGTFSLAASVPAAFALFGATLLCAPAVTAESLNEIDIAVGYTAQSLQAFDNDRIRLEQYVLDHGERTNAVLEASGAPVRLNFLAIEATGDFHQTSFSTDRRRFIAGKDGGEVLERLRDRAGADVRMLLVNYEGRGARVHYGGIFDPRRSRNQTLKNAYMMIGTNADAMTFAHELGHVLGCQHARRRPCLGARDSSLPFAYGFRSPDGIGTIMAGACATAELVPLYSNPALSHSFTPEGADQEKTVPLGSETADCVRAMTNNAPYIAALNDRNVKPFREPADDVPQVADLTDPVSASGGKVSR